MSFRFVRSYELAFNDFRLHPVDAKCIYSIESTLKKASDCVIIETDLVDFQFKKN